MQFKKKGINKEEEESVFSASDKVLEIINLTKKFGGLKAVDELNLQLKKKEIFCLLGHNGAGKTTTISLLTGLIQANEGDIQYFGYDFYSAVEQIRLKFGNKKKTIFPPPPPPTQLYDLFKQRLLSLIEYSLWFPYSLGALWINLQIKGVLANWKPFKDCASCFLALNRRALK